MIKSLKSLCGGALLGFGLAAAPLGSAEDIDIFVGASAGAADAPNIIILIDNSPNWARQAQNWPDGANQGESELNAISAVLGTISATQPVNIGLAMLTEYQGTGGNQGVGGGYIRFGARDMSVAANRTALQSILNSIKGDVNSPQEKINQSSRDESAALYEIYKYYSALTPFSGVSAGNPRADVPGNIQPATAAYVGLNSGHALVGGAYQSPISGAKPCARNYIIYVANNTDSTPNPGRIAYEPTVASAGALAATTPYDSYIDNWTRFLYTSGAVVPSTNNNGSIITYVLDAYNAKQNAGYSNALKNAAKVGGGRYFQVGSQQAIIDALKTILAEIQGINSTFASASLPVNTTNRAQDRNQVFIPMFRPDIDAGPRWMGNLKQYQIIRYGSNVDLGDSAGNPAVNPNTGFPTDCAVSFWTTDSGAYWSDVIQNPLAKGNCKTTSNSVYSDSPDGPFVEKGGVAEVMRKGNLPHITNNSPTWTPGYRTLYTVHNGPLEQFNQATAYQGGFSLSQTQVDYFYGKDINDENGNGSKTDSRPSIHGDTIHSRPLPVDYGGATGVTVFYGANDGAFRAIDSKDGRERWALIAPEFFTRMPRLATNSPQINYPSMPAGVTPAPTPKDYFFDGSTGIYQNSSNTKVWIYPTMRRGGRMLYALDVTDPDRPVFKWKRGCPNLTDDTGCSTGFSGIGQTWSKPAVAGKVVGYDKPVLIVGGGYDACEDANTATPSCATPKGALIYVLDADTGAILKSFPTTRSVAADIAPITVATVGTVDHAYAVDLGGNIYRIDFTGTYNSSGGWTMTRVAYTGGNRKFFYAPALLPVRNVVYLALGSGDREHPLQSQYPYLGVTNRFFVYLDNLTASSAAAVNLDDPSGMIDATTPTACSAAQITPGSTRKGWYMNLNQYGQGEQTVTSAVIAGGMAAFSTNRPIPASAGTCSTILGEARGYWVNLFNGSGAIGVSGACGGARSSIFAGGGLPPSPVLGTVPVDGRLTTVVIGATQRASGASTPLSPQEVTPPTNMTRRTVYWKSGEN